MTTTQTTRPLAISGSRPHSTIRLFCFPYAGGSSLIFREWADSLPNTIEVCPVQLPGRGNRMLEPAFVSLPPLVDALAEGLLQYLDKPFAFFGHSMGALIGFELARHLRRKRGLEPCHLFVSASRAPQIPRTQLLTYDLPEPEFIQELQRLNGTPKEVLDHPELMQLVVPILRADFAVCQTYSYTAEPPLDCPISAFGGLEDGDIGREHIEAWASQTNGSFSARMFPGDHFFLQTNQLLLLRMLARELHQLASAPSGAL